MNQILDCIFAPAYGKRFFVEKSIFGGQAVSLFFSETSQVLETGEVGQVEKLNYENKINKEEQNKCGNAWLQ